MRQTLILATACIMLGMSVTKAQELEDKQSFLRWMIQDDKLLDVMQPRHQVKGLVGEFPSKQLDTTLDVRSYSLEIDWYKPLLTRKDFRGPRKAECKLNTIVRSNVDGLPAVVFDAVNLTIDSVIMSSPTSKPIKVAHSVANGRLTMPTPQPLQRGEEVFMTIWYATKRDDSGMYIWNAEDAAVNGVPTGSAFTFSQPEDARRWFPCNDRPNDKALFSVRARVPKGFTVVSNGVLTDSTVDGDSATFQTWSHDRVMPTYLFSVEAANYTNYRQVFTRKDGTTVPISNFHFITDQEDSLYNAKKAYANSQKWFEALESYLGRYPFSTYGHVVATPIEFGGMEHQTMSMVNRYWLTGRAELGYVHELGHQWLGDYVTCATWGDIWLNEGGASLTEALYAEYTGGVDSYNRVLRNKRDRYMRNGQAEPPVYDIPLANLFNEATTYNKASWVYHMMRRMVGDSAFFATLKSYMETNKLGYAQTKTFMEHFAKHIPNPAVPWSTFFDQWLVRQGHPEFEAVVAIGRQASNPTTVSINVHQKQNATNVPEIFVVPLTLRIKAGDTWRDTTVLMDKASIMVEFSFPDGTLISFPDPQKIESMIDPNESLLCTRSGALFDAVQDNMENDPIRVLGPVPAFETVSVLIPQGAPAMATIIDAQGVQFGSVVVTPGVRNIDVSKLPSGVVYLRIEQGGTSTVFRVPVVH